MPCREKKNNTPTTRNITLDSTLATKGRSELKLTTGLSGYTGKGRGEWDTRAEGDIGGGGDGRDPDTVDNGAN
jgi:hypothetical protein